LEAPLGTWAARIVVSTPPAPSAGEAAVALDGTTRRGSRTHGAPGVHLWAAWSHHVGLPLAHQAVDAKTNESTPLEPVLRQIVLPDRGVTMAARLTPRHVAQTLVDEGGDEGMSVNEHQAPLRADMALVLTRPPAGARQETARPVDIGHGRIAQRTVTTRAALVGYREWPGWAQVLEVGRHGIIHKTGQERAEGGYGVTSLPPERATPGRVRDWGRGHWHIEHQSHGVREVTFDEDRSQVRCGSIPHVMAALRNTAMGLLRRAGHTQIAAACRRLAAQPAQALALIGIILEN
jgi:Transposase DDE domain